MGSSKSVSRSLLFTTQRILSQTATLVTLSNEAHFWFFSALKMTSHQNKLWPSNLRTNLKLFPRLEKQPGFFHTWLFVTIAGGWNFLFPHKTLCSLWKIMPTFWDPLQTFDIKRFQPLLFPEKLHSSTNKNSHFRVIPTTVADNLWYLSKWRPIWLHPQMPGLDPPLVTCLGRSMYKFSKVFWLSDVTVTEQSTTILTFSNPHLINSITSCEKLKLAQNAVIFIVSS